MKIYMAGALFSTAEIAFNAELAEQLRLRGHEIFLPQEHEQDIEKPDLIFKSDVAGIDWADCVLACLDGPDPDSGTCWELGYGYAKGKIIVVYRTDMRVFKGDPINLMLTESADSVVITGPVGVDRVADVIQGHIDALLASDRMVTIARLAEGGAVDDRPYKTIMDEVTVKNGVLSHTTRRTETYRHADK